MTINYFAPLAIGWETTLACNMKCEHCGSIAGYSREVELDTDQALALCAQFDAFPLAHVTLTGGETFVRPDWPTIVEDLIARRGAVGIISNAWLIDRDLAQQLRDLQGDRGRINVGISLDGDVGHHDAIRRAGSYDRVLAALDHLREAGVPSSIITTVNPFNVDDLDHVRDVALGHGCYAWQIQVTSEYGRAAENTELVLPQRLYRRVVEKVAEHRRALSGGPCLVYTADCLGYWGMHERELRQRPWHGCHAGIRSLGVQSNGNVKGCLSLLEDVFIEGNAMEQPLLELWERPGGFTYNRDFEPEMLEGMCAECRYGYSCRAGCHSTSYSMLGTVNRAPYCLYAEEQGWMCADKSSPEITTEQPSSQPAPGLPGA